MKTALFLIFNLVQFTASAGDFPLQAVLNQAHQVHSMGRTPVAVFDLDETLIHSAQRKTFSYWKALKTNEVELYASFPSEVRIAENAFALYGEKMIRSLVNEYNSNDLFQKMGIVNPAFVAKLDSLMLPIYLSNEFIRFDTAYWGAVQLLQGIYQKGAHVYFVTSRYQRTQAEETIKNLQALHLYRNPEVSTLLMRNEGESSIDFKTRSFQSILSHAAQNETVFLAAENEPENLNAMGTIFPNALLVFVRGAILNQTVGLIQNRSIVFAQDFSR